jgi:predicted nucleotidyltransferase component of viral defense system
MNKKMGYIQKEQKRITDLVIKKFKGYYLTGGTALAFYFEHRFSEDLDFFSQKYKKSDPDNIMKYIAAETKLSLMDLVSGNDVGKVFKYLDDQIFKEIPAKLL